MDIALQRLTEIRKFTDDDHKAIKMGNKEGKTYSALTVTLVAFIAILLAVIGFLMNKMNPAGIPQPAGPGLPLPAIHELKSVSGIVTGYQHNVHLDMNGLQLKKAGQGILSFEFRPHTAAAVLSAARLNDSVLIYYETQPNDEAIVYRLHKIKNLRSGISVNVDHLPPPPRIPPGQQAQTFAISNPQIVTDNYGGVVALQAPGKLFHFKPEQVEDIQSLIKNGHNFSLLAVQRGDDQGFINIHHDDVYIVISITIDNKTFMIR